jgi:hypothetical protein
VAYKPANLVNIVPRLGTGDNLAADDGGYSVALWSYRQITGDDALATMVADNYITDGNDRGLKVGDLVIFVEDTVDSSWKQVNTVSAAGLVTFITVSNP